MILDRTPLNMNEVEEILKDIPESEKKTEAEEYLKKFIKAKPSQAKKLKEELEAERIGDEKINITLLRKIISDVNLEVSEKEIEELVGKRK